MRFTGRLYTPRALQWPLQSTVPSECRQEGHPTHGSPATGKIIVHVMSPQKNMPLIAGSLLSGSRHEAWAELKLLETEIVYSQSGLACLT